MGDEWLEGYGGETTEELLALAASHRLDSIVLAFEEALEKKELEGDDAELSPEERVVMAVEALEREVNNGGYHQFFLNSSCEYVDVIVDALRQIDCPVVADITARAIARLGVEGPLDMDTVQEVIHADEDGALIEALDPFDTEFFDGEENIAERLFEFIRENAETVRVP